MLVKYYVCYQETDASQIYAKTCQYITLCYWVFIYVNAELTHSYPYQNKNMPLLLQRDALQLQSINITVTLKQQWGRTGTLKTLSKYPLKKHHEGQSSYILSNDVYKRNPTSIKGEVIFQSV